MATPSTPRTNRPSGPPVQNTPSGQLPIPLHELVSRREAYALFSIAYDSRAQRHLNIGLSPQLPDGGYFLFITLDKKSLPDDFNYEDILDDEQLIWVTRRGRDENHRDYEALRQQYTRISLFVRRVAKEEFTYLGEVRYKEHQQFHDTSTGKLQQRYILRLDVPIPWMLHARLHTPHIPSRPSSAKASASQRSFQHTRKPSTFSETKRAFQYALGDLERFVNPAHHNYQTRLKTYLQHRGVAAEFERDFVDVRWIQDGQQVIGEVKLTGYLTLDQAFRTALGQLLCYAHLQFDAPPLMVMFLDKQPDQKRLALARQLGIVVVAEPAPSSFIFCEGFEAPSIRRLFQA